MERDFWKTETATHPVSAAAASSPQMPVMAALDFSHDSSRSPNAGASFDLDYAPPRPRTLTGLPLTEGVVLLVEASYEPDEDDMESIRIAAEPLLKLLEIRRLVRPRTERKSS